MAILTHACMHNAQLLFRIYWKSPIDSSINGCAHGEKPIVTHWSSPTLFESIQCLHRMPSPVINSEFRYFPSNSWNLPPPCDWLGSSYVRPSRRWRALICDAELSGMQSCDQWSMHEKKHMSNWDCHDGSVLCPKNVDFRLRVINWRRMLQRSFIHLKHSPMNRWSSFVAVGRKKAMNRTMCVVKKMNKDKGIHERNARTRQRSVSLRYVRQAVFRTAACRLQSLTCISECFIKLTSNKSTSEMCVCHADWVQVNCMKALV